MTLAQPAQIALCRAHAVLMTDHRRHTGPAHPRVPWMAQLDLLDVYDPYEQVQWGQVYRRKRAVAAYPFARTRALSSVTGP